MAKTLLTPKMDTLLTAAAGGCIAFNVRRAARAISQYYDEFLSPVGLRGTQFSLLSATAKMGQPTVQQLADALGMDRTTLTRNLRPMERDGLIDSRPATDRRSRYLHLTAKGKKQLALALPYWHEAQESMMEKIGESRATRLLKDLSTVVSATESG